LGAFFFEIFLEYPDTLPFFFVFLYVKALQNSTNPLTIKGE